MICSPAGAHHRRWSFVILLFAITVGVIPGTWVRAQAVLIPPEVKKSNDMTPYRAQIETALASKVKELTDPAVDVQTKARIQIENETRIPGQRETPSPAYLDFYARTLNKLVDALKTNENVRIRLNAALAVANVAQASGSDGLKDAVQAFVQDKNPAVVLWGVKGAKYIVPVQLQAPGTFNPTLVKAIIDAVKTHTEGAIAGAIAGDAYDALTLDISGNPGALAKMKPQTLTTISPFVLELLNTRIQMYRKGVPPSPRSDAWGTRFLSDPSVWTLLTPPQRRDAMQAFTNLVGLAGKQAAAANKGDLRDLAYTIARAASAISTRLPAGAGAPLQPVVDLKETATAQQVQQAADSVLPIVKQQPDYKDLKSPPEITGHEAAPAPASAPTTGPVVIPGASNVPPPGAAPGTPPAPANPATPPAPTRPTPGTGTGTTPKAPTPPAKAPGGSTAHPPPNQTKPPDAR